MVQNMQSKKKAHKLEEQIWFKLAFFHEYINIVSNNIYIYIIKGSLDEKLPIYEQDPKSKRLDSFEKRCVRD